MTSFRVYQCPLFLNWEPLFLLNLENFNGDYFNLLTNARITFFFISILVAHNGNNTYLWFPGPVTKYYYIFIIIIIIIIIIIFLSFKFTLQIYQRLTANIEFDSAENYHE